MAQGKPGQLGSFHRSIRKRPNARRAGGRQDRPSSTGLQRVEKLTSILAVIDPSDESRHVVVKAMVPARHFRARVELFLCDSERAYTLRHAYDPAGQQEANRACLAGGHAYLEAIRRSIAEDVTVA